MIKPLDVLKAMLEVISEFISDVILKALLSPLKPISRAILEGFSPISVVCMAKGGKVENKGVRMGNEGYLMRGLMRDLRGKSMLFV